MGSYIKPYFLDTTFSSISWVINLFPNLNFFLFKTLKKKNFIKNYSIKITKLTSLKEISCFKSIFSTYLIYYTFLSTNIKTKKVIIPIIKLPLMDPYNTIVINNISKTIISKLTKTHGLHFETLNLTYGYKKAVVQIILTNKLRFFIELTPFNIVIFDGKNPDNKLNFFVFLYSLGLSFKHISMFSRYGNTKFFKTLLKKTPNLIKTTIFPFFYNKLSKSFYLKVLNLFEFKTSYYGVSKLFKDNLIKNYEVTKSPIFISTDFIFLLDNLFDMYYKKCGGFKFNNLGLTHIQTCSELLKIHFEHLISVFFDSKIDKKKIITTKFLEFLTINPLIQYLEQINSVTELMAKNKLSNTNSITIKDRDINTSFLGKICILETCENINSGLVLSLVPTALTKKTKLYSSSILLNMVTNKLENFNFLSSVDQEKTSIIFKKPLYRLNTKILENKSLNFKFGNYELTKKRNSTYLPLPFLLSYSENLIPFLMFNDPTRCLMGARMQTQSVPLVFSKQKAFLITGYESLNLVPSKLLISYQEGVILFVSSIKIILLDIFGREVIYFLNSFYFNNNGIIQKFVPVVWVGERIKVGQLLAEPIDLKGYELSIGKNIYVLYGYYKGFEYEDALIINRKSLVDQIFTSLHFDFYESVYNKSSFPQYLEIPTNLLPKRNLFTLRHLDNYGVVKEGSFLLSNDIILSKLKIGLYTIPINNLGNFVKEIFGINLKQISDKSISIKIGQEGRISKVEIFSFKSHPLEILIRIFSVQHKLITVGDKLCGRHGNKGVISAIIDTVDLPYGTNSLVPDLITGPLGVPSRMNLGQLCEACFGSVCFLKNTRYLVSPALNTKLMLTDLKIKSYKIFHILKTLGIRFNPYNPGNWSLRDGLNGKFLKTEIFGGISYYSKLIHMVKNKIHVRSIGPYNLISQQPTKGRTKEGGQRFGEMEVWALEAFGASYNLKELFSSKADTVKDRHLMFDHLYFTKFLEVSNTLPDTFKNLLLELNSLALNLESFCLKNVVDK